MPWKVFAGIGELAQVAAGVIQHRQRKFTGLIVAEIGLIDESA